MIEGASELELVLRAAAGERLALEELLLTHYDRLGARIARKLPRLLSSTLTEEDILQQTFAEVFQRISSFRPKGSWAFYRWMATIADHRLQDAIKAQRAAKRGGGRLAAHGYANADTDSMSELVDLISAGEDSPSQSAARHEAAAAVQVGLASLEARYREAVQLRYIQNLSVEEAARLMNRKPRAVRDLCTRGLKELRVVLGRSSQYFSRH